MNDERPKDAALEPALDTETPDEAVRPGSLLDEVESLVEDGRTYAEAELAFQKSRLAYVAEHAKWAAIFGGLAAVLVVLAVVGLVIGALLALTPELTAWGAAGVVFAVLVVVAFIMVRMASAKWKGLLQAFEAQEE
jgi:uncharacterized membrane protein YqjE